MASQFGTDETVNFIKNLWPNFQCSRYNIENPDENFVMAFLKCFMEDTERKLAQMVCIDNDVLINMEENEFDVGYTLYAYANHIIKIFMGPTVEFFTLNDVYNPTKRFKTFVSLAVNILVFITSNVDYPRKIIMEELAKKNDFDNVLINIEEMKVKISEKANQIVLNAVEYEELEKEYENLCGEFKNLKRTEQEENIVIEKRNELKLLEQECENTELILKQSNEIKENLQKQIVCPKEYEHLKNVQANLKIELNTLKEEVDSRYSNIESKKKYIEDLNILNEIIGSIELPSLKVDLINDKQLALQTVQQELSEMSTRVDTSNANVLKIIKNIDLLQNEMESIAVKTTDEKNNILSCINNIKKESKNLENEREKKDHQIKVLQFQKDDCTSNIVKLENELKDLNNYAANKYKSMLEVENDLITMNHHTLKRLYDILSEKNNV